MSEIWESFVAYLRAIGLWWWAALVAIEGLISVLERSGPWKLRARTYRWLALVLFLIAAPFFAFHNQRLEHQRVLESIRSDHDAELLDLSKSRKDALQEQAEHYNRIFNEMNLAKDLWRALGPVAKEWQVVELAENTKGSAITLGDCPSDHCLTAHLERAFVRGPVVTFSLSGRWGFVDLESKSIDLRLSIELRKDCYFEIDSGKHSVRFTVLSAERTDTRMVAAVVQSSGPGRFSWGPDCEVKP